MPQISPENLTILAGLAGGLVLGWIGLRANFCVMGGITDIVLMGDWRRVRAWLLAASIALLGTEGLLLSGRITLDQAPYLAPGFGWPAAAIGGLLFGFGMTLAGGCVQRSLVRLGAGSPKALLVIAMVALFAYLTAQGPLDMPRPGLTNIATPEPDLAAWLAAAFGLPLAPARAAIVAALGVGLLIFCLWDRSFRASPRDWGAGLAYGLAVCFGWLVTAGRDSFNFVTPFGAWTWDFGAAGVLGLVAGAFLAVALPWRMRTERFAGPGDVAHHAVGGALMGVGGTLALGCTIGQGVTGLSTLAFGSFAAWAGIVGGAVLAVRYLEARGA